MKFNPNLIVAALILATAGAASAQTVVGIGATATLPESTAIGAKANGTGFIATATGAQSVASNHSATANGFMARATGLLTTAIGTLTNVTSDSGTGLGYQASATGLASTALGTSTEGREQNSTAIGFSAVADRANTVSFGIASGVTNRTTLLTDITRQLVNVADGTQASDVATFGQLTSTAATINGRIDGVSTVANSALSLATTAQASAIAADTKATAADAKATAADTKATTAQVTATAADTKATTAMLVAQETSQQVGVLTGRVDAFDGRVSNLEAKVGGMGRRINGGVALSMAANAAVAVNLAPGETALVAGVGGFRGQSALSVGIQSENRAGQSFRAVISTSSVGTAYGVGGAFKF